MARHSYPPTSRNISMMDMEHGAPVTRPIRADSMAKAKAKGVATAATARERRPALPASASAGARAAVAKPRGPKLGTTGHNTGHNTGGPPPGTVERRPTTLAHSARSSETLNAPGSSFFTWGRVLALL